MTLEDLANAADDLRNDILFNDGHQTEGLDLMAEQELLSALTHLMHASIAARKAHLLQVRALAQSPYRL